MQSPNYEDVTELPGTEISNLQLRRMYNRYHWTAEHCADKDVLEVACGAGQGVGYIGRVAASVTAGDFSEAILSIARDHYDNRYKFLQFDAQEMPFEDNSFDTVVMHEALYYLSSADQFIRECTRVLRPDGQVLLTNSNKDLPDFNPSRYSTVYHGVVELNELFWRNGFSVDFFGSEPLKSMGFREKVLRPLKWFAVRFGLIPKTMRGKRFIRQIIFGKLAAMPNEVVADMAELEKLYPLDPNKPCRDHKIIYCVAKINPQIPIKS